MQKKKIENIEVAVRVRPLNGYETRVHEELAWDVKKGGLAGNRQRQLNRSQDRHFLDGLNENQDMVIALKNKYRFGFDSRKKEEAKKSKGKKGHLKRGESAKSNFNSTIS